MALASDMQVVVAAYLDFSIRRDSEVLFRSQHRNTIALDGDSTLITHFQSAVISNLLLHIPLSTQVDQLIASAIVHRQFVVATRSGGAVGAKYGFGFVFGQWVGRRRDLVDQAAGDQRITVVGPVVKINAGGSAGSGTGIGIKPPVLPGAADKDKAGSLMDQALLNAPPEKVKPKAFFVFSE